MPDERPPNLITDRLRIWLIRTPAHGEHDGRTLAVATTHAIDWPGVAVSACIASGAYGRPSYVDWVQTSDPVRGMGLAAEMLAAIADAIGPLHLDPVSESGERLAARLA